MTPNSNDVFLGRQPILDRQQTLVAYELLFRATRHDNFASFDDGKLATATVIRNVFTELSISDALGSYQGFINVDENTLFSDIIELLPTQTVVLEILETVVPSEQVIARCAQLKELGYTLALDDVCQINEPFIPLLPHIEIVKVDLKATDPEELPKLVHAVHQLGKKILAEKVDSLEQMQHCHALGFDLFQGYFFARPVIIQGKKLDHSQLALMRLMNLLVSEADNHELEQVLKEEPGLTLNLLRLTNSVASGLPVKVTSLRHAITVLGRRQLQRWLQLLFYTAGTGQKNNPLLQMAATRGRLMEGLAGKLGNTNNSFVENAFMTGILSLTPALLGQPMDDIIDSLSLHRDVENALRDQTGRHGDLLKITQHLEDMDYAGLDAVLPRLPGLSIGEITDQLTQAMAWANALGQENQAD